MALTVSEVADLIRPPGADLVMVVDRLRHWTAAGLLNAAGDPNPGTGRKRTYDEDALYHAAILNALADTGLPIGKQRFFMNVLLCAQRAKNEWAKNPRGGLFLEIADFGESDPERVTHAVYFHGGRKKDHFGNFIHPRADAATIVNVSRLFHRIDERRKAAQSAAIQSEKLNERKSARR